MKPSHNPTRPPKSTARPAHPSRHGRSPKSLARGLLALACAGGLALALDSTPSPAQEPDEKSEVPVLREVVVTATRRQEEIRKVPGNVTVITEKDIENWETMTVADLLRSQEGIVVRDLLGNGKAAQVDLRGFGETAPFNTLVLVDGRRVNEIDLSGVDWTQIPLDQVERLEIVRGTGSVLYGDNAVGGVINIITKSPEGKPSAMIGGVGGSYGRNGAKASVGGGTEKIAASLTGSYDATSGYRDNEDFRRGDVGGKVIYDVTDAISLNLTGSYHRDEYGLPGPLTEAEVEVDRRSTSRPLDNARTRDGYLKLGTDWDLGEYGRIVADLSYRDRNNRDEFVSYSSASDRDTATWAFTPRYIWDGEITDRPNTLTAGIDIYASDLDADFFFGTPLAPSGFSRIEKDSYGFYASDEFSLSDNLILSLGARHEEVKYDLEQEDFLFGLVPLDETVKDSANAYTAGLTLLYGKRSSAFVRVNQSFRFPLTDELVVFDFVNTGSIRINSDIKPQIGHHLDIGVRHFFTPDVQANVTLFHAEIEDEIFFNPLTYTNENYPETLHQGIEVGARAQLLKKITVFGNYTYEKATFEKGSFSGNDIPAVPRHKANLGLKISDFAPGLTFAADYNYVGSSYLISDVANDSSKLDAYFTVNARLTYNWKWLRAYAGVNNATDEKYSEYGVVSGFSQTSYFYPAPGRNWVAGIEASF
ncbi:MAG: TonB-dependent receptor [Deltaproteobacteria bacterium]|nr:TonB-dependent receptor [Deltaproteobacteria bacterium]